jgi:integrase
LVCSSYCNMALGNSLGNWSAEVETGQVAKSHAGSVADLVDRWLDDITPTRTAYTMREHRCSVERDIKPAIGAFPLDRLSARDLDQLYRELLGRGLSPASVRRHHSILHAALDHAVEWGIAASNPADRATPPGTTRSTVTAPSVKEVQRLISSAETLDAVLAAAIALGAVTGARRGELCALRWSDVDWVKCPRRCASPNRSPTRTARSTSPTRPEACPGTAASPSRSRAHNCSPEVTSERGHRGGVAPDEI